MYATSPHTLPDLLPERDEKRPFWKRALAIGGLIVLLAVGILGSIFPIIPGFPFLIGAVALLPMAVPGTRGRINAWERRLSMPRRMKLRRAIEKIPIKAIRDAVSH